MLNLGGGLVPLLLMLLVVLGLLQRMAGLLVPCLPLVWVPTLLKLSWILMSWVDAVHAMTALPVVG